MEQTLCKSFRNMYIGFLTLTFPESTTNLTPSIVIDVSAMFVDTIHFRTFSGG